MVLVTVGEDVWIPSVCSMCPDQCGILVHRVGSVVTKIQETPRARWAGGASAPAAWPASSSSTTPIASTSR